MSHTPGSQSLLTSGQFQQNRPLANGYSGFFCRNPFLLQVNSNEGMRLSTEVMLAGSQSLLTSGQFQLGLVDDSVEVLTHASQSLLTSGQFQLEMLSMVSALSVTSQSLLTSGQFQHASLYNGIE